MNDFHIELGGAAVGVFAIASVGVTGHGDVAVWVDAGGGGSAVCVAASTLCFSPCFCMISDIFILYWLRRIVPVLRCDWAR